MAVYISETDEKSIKAFNKKEWYYADMEHYKKPIKWISKPLIFKAQEDGKIVGTVKAHYDMGVVYIKNLIVTSKKRRRGIGKKLLQKVEKKGRKLGAHKIYFYTMEEWESVYFYEKLGFKKTAELKKHYLKKDFVIYTKLLR